MSDRRRYWLVCTGCGTRYDDDGLRLSCDNEHEPTLLRTSYGSAGFAAEAPDNDLFRFAGWLPVVRSIPDSPSSITYRATQLGERIGLADLWVTFSGHWPERGANMPTVTFKDLEASTVLGRLPDRPPVLVIASAGNTAAAFADACSRHGVRCLIIIPGRALYRQEFAEPLSGCVRLVAIGGDATYDDAIRLADAVGGVDGYHVEGGIRNVGRRDGLGTCLLSAFEAAGRLPDSYFQGVGSAAGTIAAHEAAGRLRRWGRTDPLPRLMMCQNAPFAPVYQAWRRSNGGPSGVPAGEAAEPVEASGPDMVMAQELTNGRPPYTVHGGIHEVLRESGGDVLLADNRAAVRAMSIFEDVEGVDLEPAAGVALAGLMAAVESGQIGRQEMVLLNVTGGGRRRRNRDVERTRVEPDLWIDACQVRDAADIAAKVVAETVERFF